MGPRAKAKAKATKEKEKKGKKDKRAKEKKKEKKAKRDGETEEERLLRKEEKRARKGAAKNELAAAAEGEELALALAAASDAGVNAASAVAAAQAQPVSPVVAAKDRATIWAEQSAAIAFREVPVFVDAEEALRSLPARIKTFEEAGLPDEPGERRDALAAMAALVVGLKRPQDLDSFLRVLQVAVVKRHRLESGLPTEPSQPPARPPPLRAPPAPAPPPPPRAIPWQSRDDLRTAKPPLGGGAAAASVVSARPPLAVPLQTKDVPDVPPPADKPPFKPAVPEPKMPPKAPSKAEADQKAMSAAVTAVAAEAQKQAELQLRKKTKKKQDPAVAKKAIAEKIAEEKEAADKVFLVCKVMQDKRPVLLADETLHEGNLRLFVPALLGAATTSVHWETAWQQMCLPEELRVQAGRLFLNRLLELAAGPPAEMAEKVANVIAFLSRGHRIKMKVVEEVLAGRLCSGGAGAPSSHPETWTVVSCLICHWLPQPKNAGWGWFRVGWSWMEWWKVTERLLAAAVAKEASEQAFTCLKSALLQMQEHGGGAGVFLRQPWTEERIGLLSSRLLALLLLPSGPGEIEKSQAQLTTKLLPVDLSGREEEQKASDSGQSSSDES